MRSDVLIVARVDRRPLIECHGGVAARLTDRATVHLVSSAATPLGGDVIACRVIVEVGATLTVRSAAATIALPSVGERTSHGCWSVEVAGSLDIELEPTIVAADARHHAALSASVDGGGRFRFAERVQIGRSGESDGYWTGSMRVDVANGPLLRHRVGLGAGSAGDDVIAAPRALQSELRYPADAFLDLAQTAGTPLALAAGGVLTTWQGPKLG